jgi:hypothetical protein
VKGMAICVAVGLVFSGCTQQKNYSRSFVSENNCITEIHTSDFPIKAEGRFCQETLIVKKSCAAQTEYEKKFEVVATAKDNVCQPLTAKMNGWVPKKINQKAVTHELMIAIRSGLSSEEAKKTINDLRPEVQLAFNQQELLLAHHLTEYPTKNKKQWVLLSELIECDCGIQVDISYPIGHPEKASLSVNELVE